MHRIFTLLVLISMLPTAAFAAERTFQERKENVALPGNAQCFDYYKYGSMQTVFSGPVTAVKAGEEITFSGEIMNDNPFPIVDVGVYVKIIRKETDDVKVRSYAHHVVDQFFAVEHQHVPAATQWEKGKRVAQFSWKVPSQLPNGEYSVLTYTSVAGRFNMSGLPFTDDVTGGSTDFWVSNGREGVPFFDKSQIFVNEQNYLFAGFFPAFSKDEDVKVVAKIANPQQKELRGTVTWTVYDWDAQRKENILDTKTTQVTLLAGGTTEVSYTQKHSRGSATQVVGVASFGDAKSIVNIRFAREGMEEGRLNAIGLTQFPARKDQEGKMYACYHATSAAGVQNATLSLVLSDDKGNTIEESTVQTDAVGSISGYVLPITFKKDYDVLHLTATLKNGEVVHDQVTLSYQCGALQDGCGVQPLASHLKIDQPWLSQVMWIFAVLCTFGVLSFAGWYFIRHKKQRHEEMGAMGGKIALIAIMIFSLGLIGSLGMIVKFSPFASAARMIDGDDSGSAGSGSTGGTTGGSTASSTSGATGGSTGSSTGVSTFSGSGSQKSVTYATGDVSWIENAVSIEDNCIASSLGMPSLAETKRRSLGAVGVSQKLAAIYIDPYDDPGVALCLQSLPRKNIQINYNAQVAYRAGASVPEGSRLGLGESISFATPKQTSDISWFASGSIYDSPYGYWDAPTAKNDICAASNGFALGATRYGVFHVSYPGVSYVGSGSIHCSGNICNAISGGPGSVTVQYAPTIYNFKVYSNYGCTQASAQATVLGMHTAAVPAQAITFNYDVSGLETSPEVYINNQTSASYTVDYGNTISSGVLNWRSVNAASCSWAGKGALSNSPIGPGDITASAADNVVTWTGALTCYNADRSKSASANLTVTVNPVKIANVNVWSPSGKTRLQTGEQSDYEYVATHAAANSCTVVQKTGGRELSRLANQPVSGRGSVEMSSSLPVLVTVSCLQLDGASVVDAQSYDWEPPVPPPLSVDLEVSKNPLDYADKNITLSWRASGVQSAASCVLKKNGVAITVPPVSSGNGLPYAKTDTLAYPTGATYEVTCTEDTRTAADSVVVAYTPVPAATASLYADDTTLEYNQSTLLRWDSANATVCRITRNAAVWQTNLTPSNRFIGISTGVLTADTTFSLYCSGPVGESIPSTVVVRVDDPIDDAWCRLVDVPQYKLAPNETFTASMQMQNTGNTTWNNTYALANVGGASWGISSLPVTGTVSPGGRREFTSENFKAPAQEGIYPFVWQMKRTGSGDFGTECRPATSPNLIVERPKLYVAPMYLDFSPYPAVGDIRQKSFTLENLGGGLIDGNIRIVNGGGEYTISGPSTFALRSNSGQRSFFIDFLPTAISRFVGKVSVRNTSNQEIGSVDLNGEGIPAIEGTRAVDFGDVPLTRNGMKAYSLQNIQTSGGGRVRLQWEENPQTLFDFERECKNNNGRFSGLEKHFVSLEKCDLRFVFSPKVETEIDAYQGRLSVYFDADGPAEEEKLFEVSLFGNAIEPKFKIEER